MDFKDIDIIREIEDNGYCVIPDVLTHEEVETAKSMFYDWQNTIPNHDHIHGLIDPHGIYKFHEAGHQRHAWYLRTRSNIQAVFKKLWNTDDLICSYDGSCYISKSCKKKDRHWIHSDQAPDTEGLQCIQGFVSLTDNKERTFVIYEKSHLYHSEYFKERQIYSKKNWHLIDHETLDRMRNQRRVLHIKAGSLVIWDSRMFHSNQYGKANSEERIVQYICYLPRKHKKYTASLAKKRRKYFEERRTTSHWPVPVYVNGKQPQTFGNKDRLIDYDKLTIPKLDDLMSEIEKLI